MGVVKQLWGTEQVQRQQQEGKVGGGRKGKDGGLRGMSGRRTPSVTSIQKEPSAPHACGVTLT